MRLGLRSGAAGEGGAGVGRRFPASGLSKPPRWFRRSSFSFAGRAFESFIPSDDRGNFPHARVWGGIP